MQDTSDQVCSLCGTPGTTFELTELTLGRGGVEVSIRGLPSFHCRACGEMAIPGPLAVEISEAAEHILVVVERYESQRAVTARGTSLPR